MTQVGLSTERLSKITVTLKADVAKGVHPGAVLLVARHGKIAMFATGDGVRVDDDPYGSGLLRDHGCPL